MNGIMDAGLADRGDACNLVKIPTGRYPLFSTTKEAIFDANGNAEIDFEAERDYLFTELTVEGVPAVADGLLLVNAEYCNTRYLENSSARNWAACCNRKPFFLVGVRENKTLKFRVTGGLEDDPVQVTLAGFQGSGCCG